MAKERPGAAGTTCDACAGMPPTAEGKPRVASTTCARVVAVLSIMSAGGVVVAGTPPAPAEKPSVVSTPCKGRFISAGGPPAAEGKPCAASTACEPSAWGQLVALGVQGEPGDEKWSMVVAGDQDQLDVAVLSG